MRNNVPRRNCPASPIGGSSAKGGEGGYLSVEYQVSQKLHALRDHDSLVNVILNFSVDTALNLFDLFVLPPLRGALLSRRA